MKKVSIVFASAALSVGLCAENITLTVTGIQALEDSSSSFLSNGSAVWVGTFLEGYDIAGNAADFSSLSANFGYYDDSGSFVGGTQIMTTSITDFGGGNPGSFSVSSSSVEDAGGTQPPVYVWAFNNAVASSATEYGVFQLSDLVNGVSPLGINQSLNFAADNVATLIGSFDGSIGTLQAVPEPTTYAAIFAGLIGCLTMLKRRRLS